MQELWALQSLSNQHKAVAAHPAAEEQEKGSLAVAGRSYFQPNDSLGTISHQNSRGTATKAHLLNTIQL